MRFRYDRKATSSTVGQVGAICVRPACPTSASIGWAGRRQDAPPEASSRDGDPLLIPLYTVLGRRPVQLDLSPPWSPRQTGFHPPRYRDGPGTCVVEGGIPLASARRGEIVVDGEAYPWRASGGRENQRVPRPVPTGPSRGSGSATTPTVTSPPHQCVSLRGQCQRKPLYWCNLLGARLGHVAGCFVCEPDATLYFNDMDNLRSRCTVIEPCDSRR